MLVPTTLPAVLIRRHDEAWPDFNKRLAAVCTTCAVGVADLFHQGMAVAMRPGRVALRVEVWPFDGPEADRADTHLAAAVAVAGPAVRYASSGGAMLILSPLARPEAPHVRQVREEWTMPGERPGRPPFGFTYAAGSTLAPHPVQADALRMAYRLEDQGDDAVAIAAALLVEFPWLRRLWPESTKRHPRIVVRLLHRREANESLLNGSATHA